MKVAIVGAGAMGGAFAADLARGGHEVILVDVDEPLVCKIRTEGLRVATPEGEEVVKLGATSDPAEAEGAAFIIVFVKAQHTRSAARTASTIAGPDTVVATLQNGWGNADVIAEQVPPERLVIGVTYHSSTVAGLAHVRHTGRGPTYVGPYLPGGDTAPARRLAELLASGGIDTEATAEVRTEVWKKLILNAATLPTAALARLPAGDLAAHEEMLGLVDALATEAVKVAQAQGLAIELDERLDRIHTVLRNAGKGRASMLQDVEGRRKTEIETVNAAVARVAKEHGVDVPLNRAMVALVHGLERSWQL